jgi:2-phospho-L-lactate guanylyltransferase
MPTVTDTAAAGIGGWISVVEQWTAIVPVKALDDAKSRLSAGPRRAEWALAFAVDTVRATLDAPGIRDVIVITDDERVRTALGANGLATRCTTDGGGGLNSCLERAATTCDGPVVMLLGDLPALTGSAVQAFLDFAEHGPVSFVADAHGTGTTMLAEHSRITPRFGERSRAAHTAAGYAEFTGATARLRRDVDDDIDLWDAARLGVGPATAALLARGSGDA